MVRGLVGSEMCIGERCLSSHPGGCVLHPVLSLHPRWIRITFRSCRRPRPGGFVLHQVLSSHPGGFVLHPVLSSHPGGFVLHPVLSPHPRWIRVTVSFCRRTRPGGFVVHHVLSSLPGGSDITPVLSALPVSCPFLVPDPTCTSPAFIPYVLIAPSLRLTIHFISTIY